jgi:hypothetical protein
VDDGKIRSATIQEWIAKGLVPVKSKQTLYDLLKNLIASTWGKTGRPRLVASDDIPRLVIGLDGHKGLVISLEDVKVVIVRVRKETLRRVDVLKQFKPLYQYAAKHGHVPDEVPEANGIPRDIDMYGNEVRREAGISNESCQRAKWLSYKFVKLQRRDRLTELEAKAQDKFDMEETKRASLLEYNLEYKEKLRPLLAADSNVVVVAGSHEFANATLKHFASSKLLAKHLKAFAHVRKEPIKLKKGQAWPKKRILGDAESGQDVMIKVAFDCHTAAVRLEKETEPSSRRGFSDQENDEDMQLQTGRVRSRLHTHYHHGGTGVSCRRDVQYYEGLA